jgi:putative ABC transport system substrate-binding protein
LIDETQTARTARVHLVLADIRRPQELDAAVAGMAKQRVAAVIVDAALTPWRAAELVSQHRLPSVSNQRNFVDAGGLIFHGAQTADLHRRAAAYVDKILKGTKPAQLPVERPTKFELVINLKTARTLGLASPPSLLVRADQVIE